MANPTTNYGFVMPTNTDLVKDLPADFDVFGQAVDTKIKDLNPETTAGDISYRGSTANAKTRLGIGTARQVLAVNAGATAPEWVPSASSTLTTTGDTLYASAANTLARLGIGTTGQVLTVSGGVPTWAAAATGGMTSLATGSLSSTTTTLSSISGAYRTLQLVIVGAQISTAGSPIAFTVNGTTTGYWRLRAALDTATWSVPAATEASFRPDGSNLPTTANSRIAILTIDEYATTGLKSFRYSSSSDVAGAVAFGNQTTITAAITSIGITSVAGTNSFSAGTYTLYGVK